MKIANLCHHSIGLQNLIAFLMHEPEGVLKTSPVKILDPTIWFFIWNSSSQLCYCLKILMGPGWILVVLSYWPPDKFYHRCTFVFSTHFSNYKNVLKITIYQNYCRILLKKHYSYSYRILFNIPRFFCVPGSIFRDCLLLFFKFKST